MKTISRWISKFCYNHPNFGIPNLMLYIAVGNVAIGLIDNFSAYSLSTALFFYRPAIFQGEIWRLVSFIFVPITSDFGILNFTVPGTSFFNEDVQDIVRVHFAKKDETLYEALNRLSDIKKKMA